MTEKVNIFNDARQTQYTTPRINIIYSFVFENPNQYRTREIECKPVEYATRNMHFNT